MYFIENTPDEKDPTNLFFSILIINKYDPPIFRLVKMFLYQKII